MIYLDYAASSPPFSQVMEKTNSVSLHCYGNPGAVHTAGDAARSVLHESRKTIASALQVRPEEVFFTSGGTEANNWAVKYGCSLPGRRHILCSAAEHQSVLASVRYMERKGYDVTYLRPDASGRILPGDVQAALRPDTALLCVQAVNNETGVIQDMEALSELARRNGTRYLCDSVQSFGHLRQNLHKADLISLSAHKLGGPRGIGCLVVRQPHRLPPLLDGGGQEFGLRSGTENLPGIAGFAEAARLSLSSLPQEQRRIRELADLLEQQLRLLEPGLQIAGESAPRTGIVCCAFPPFSGEEMVMRLSLKGICASPGAACAARNQEPSHVLLSMGYPPAEASRFLRFSLGRNTTPQEIFETVAAVEAIYKRRR